MLFDMNDGLLLRGGLSSSRPVHDVNEFDWKRNRRRYDWVHPDYWSWMDYQYPEGFRIFGFLSHWHGAKAMQTIQDPLTWYKLGMPCPVRLVGGVSDNPIERPYETRAGARLWRHYDGEELEFFADLCPRLARNYGIRWRQSKADFDFVRSTRPNVVLSVVNWQWVGSRIRRLAGEVTELSLTGQSSVKAGHCFGIHPTDRRGGPAGLRRYGGVTPFEQLLLEKASHVRLAFHQLVPGQWDHPDYHLRDSEAVAIDWLHRMPFRSALKMMEMVTGELIPDFLLRSLAVQLQPALFHELHARTHLAGRRPPNVALFELWRRLRKIHPPRIEGPIRNDASESEFS